MVSDFQLTGYDFYTDNAQNNLIEDIVSSVKEIIAQDRLEKQPLFLKIPESFIYEVARKVVQDRQKAFLIGIAGESASGKTTFVDNTVKAFLEEKKEGIYTVIRCDDYFYDTSKELCEAGSYEEYFKAGFSFDTPKAINLDLMKEHLLALKNGESVVSPRYDFVTCESCMDGEIKKPAEIILNEGLYVLNDGLKEIMDISVYVFTPIDVIKDRWFKRAATRGKTGEAAQMQFKDTNETAQRYIRPTMQHADVVINGMVKIDYIEVITDKLFTAIKASC